MGNLVRFKLQETACTLWAVAAMSALFRKSLQYYLNISCVCTHSGQPKSWAVVCSIKSVLFRVRSTHAKLRDESRSLYTTLPNCFLEYLFLRNFADTFQLPRTSLPSLLIRMPGLQFLCFATHYSLLNPPLVLRGVSQHS